MSVRRILNVGQCSYDHHQIERFLHSSFGAEVSRAATAVQALDLLRAETFDLVLVNRVFDADRASGLAFLEDLRSDATLAKTPVMLISDYPDAQKQAEKLGALPGFGKSELWSPACIERLEKALGPRTT